MVVALAVLAVAIGWWLRRPDGASNDTDQASGAATPGSSRSKRAGGVAFTQPTETGRTIAGVVVMDGVPFPGATVRLISTRTIAGLPEPRVISDAAGRFDFGPQLATRYVVAAEKPSVTGATLAVDLRNPAAQPDQLRLVVHACDASVHGTIRDSSGGVIAKARVELAYGGTGVDGDGEGRYELCLPVGDNQLVLSADGYATAQASIRAFGRVRRDFSLVPEAIVVGRVVRADDRSPVAGASIELSRDDVPRISLQATSDDDGRFRVTGVTPGNHRITATGDRTAMKQAANVTAEIGREEPVVLVLEAAFSISGRVVERGGGAVSGTRIYATSDHVEMRALDGITQLDGRFVLEPAPPGNQRLYVPNFSIGPVKVTVESKDVDDVVIEVEPMASIAGRVMLDGKPVDGCNVQSSGASGVTDADGRFLLSVSPGPQQISAESNRVGAFTRGPKFELAKGEHKTGVEIELDLAGSIAGTVVDQHGAPVGGAMLEFSLLRGSDVGVATTADDGSFTARALSGGGDYGYVVKSGSRLTYPPVEGKRFPPIAVRDGKTHVTGVRIAIRYERLAITGRVVSSKNEPIPDVVVRADPRKDSPMAPTVVTDVNGTFAIRDLQAGAYTLRASSTRGDEKVEDVQAGRDDVVIRFPEPGAIEGTLDGFDQPVEIDAVRTDGTARSRTTASGDTFRFRSIAPGSYRVAASSPNGVANEVVTVTAGGVARLTLRKVGMGGVVTTVVDDTGRPVPKLRCYMDRAYVYLDSNDVTDGAGQFRFEKVLAGTSTVACYDDRVVANGQVTVVAGRTTRIELRTEKRAKRPGGYAGLELASQLDEVVVKAVLAGGPAERAGVLVGDVVVKIDDRDPEPQIWRTLDTADVGTKVKLTLERADKERIIYVTIEAAPGPSP